MTDALELDAVVFGGGAAGLWTLDELVRAGLESVLLEAGELGCGQTVASQGIIHGGMKYTLGGWLSASARAIAGMPDLWRACLAGEAQPDLSATRLRSHFCHLWQTGTLKSRLGMLGARAGLRVRPRVLDAHERPALLRDCPGSVARLDEQVIEPWSFLTALSDRHRGRVFRIDVQSGLEFETDASAAEAKAVTVRLLNPETGSPLDLRVRTIVFAAGAGNAELRAMAGLSGGAMQRRPLQMVMLRGKGLPAFHGHCVDGAATRVTITSTRDFSNLPVWQVGGQVAERAVSMDDRRAIEQARDELTAVLPSLDVRNVQWATYRVDRAEAANAGARPSDASVLCDGPFITAWPTKMALAPRVATLVCNIVKAAAHRPARQAREPLPSALHGWPRPVVALPPWETTPTWMTLD